MTSTPSSGGVLCTVNAFMAVRVRRRLTLTRCELDALDSYVRQVVCFCSFCRFVYRHTHTFSEIKDDYNDSVIIVIIIIIGMYKNHRGASKLALKVVEAMTSLPRRPDEHNIAYN